MADERSAVYEEIEEGLEVKFEVLTVLASKQTQWQKAQIVDTVTFGKVLLLDGLVQSAEVDERVYHECLVHPPLLQHPNPKRVFIGGGGEGSTAREVLRHKSVEKCVMVDIDRDVVAFCKEHFEQNCAAFSDSRLELIFDDAFKALSESTEQFDVIILDLDDPLEGGPCFQLYTQEFYQVALTKLGPGGILLTQSGAAGVKSHNRVFTPIHNTLRSVFPKVVAYTQHVYSFTDEWGWNMAFTDTSASVLSASEVEKRIAERIEGENFFYNGETHTAIFCLAPHIRQNLENETHIMSLAAPRFMHGKGSRQ